MSICPPKISRRQTAASNGKIATIGRNLAEALRDYAYTRKDDDKKRVVALQMELIEYVKSEEKDDDKKRVVALQMELIEYVKSEEKTDE